jgi:hypothetical protein
VMTSLDGPGLHPASTASGDRRRYAQIARCVEIKSYGACGKRITTLDERPFKRIS